MKTTLRELLNQYSYCMILRELSDLANEESFNAMQDGRFQAESFYRNLSIKIETVVTEPIVVKEESFNNE